MNAIEVSKVSKIYPSHWSQWERAKSVFTLGRSRPEHAITALDEISFEVERGESFGILGENGAGKSTLLKIICGVIQPTTGTITTHGRLSALLELGSGFNPEFTGRENVYMNASILGLSNDDIDAAYQGIVDFAEIGDFLDQPIRTYSSGMIMRLAFSVAIHVNPEILIVDEALAVGDIYFRQRCLRKVHELRDRGVTILYVSHDTSDLKALCERCIWLRGGRIQESGPTDSVVAKYLAAMVQKDVQHRLREQAIEGGKRASVVAPEIIRSAINVEHRYGDRRASILGVTAVKPDGSAAANIDGGSTIVIRVSVQADAVIQSPIAGFLFRDSQGQTISGTNTTRENRSLPPMIPGDISTIDFYWTVPHMRTGKYFASVAVSDGTLEQFTVCDYAEDAVEIYVTETKPVTGYFYFPSRVTRVVKRNAE